MYYFLEFKFLESDRPSSSPVQLPGTMLSMKFCNEWCRDQGLLSQDIKSLRFWVLGFQGFATYPNCKVLGFQGLGTIKILRSWVFKVSLHIKILRSWVSRVLRHDTILRSWVSRVPRKKGHARSKIHQGPRHWTQQTQDLEPFWNLGTSLAAAACTALGQSCRRYLPRCTARLALPLTGRCLCRRECSAGTVRAG